MLVCTVSAFTRSCGIHSGHWRRLSTVQYYCSSTVSSLAVLPIKTESTPSGIKYHKWMHHIWIIQMKLTNEISFHSSAHGWIFLFYSFLHLFFFFTVSVSFPSFLPSVSHLMRHLPAAHCKWTLVTTLLATLFAKLLQHLSQLRIADTQSSVVYRFIAMHLSIKIHVCLRWICTARMCLCSQTHSSVQTFHSGEAL